MQWLLQALAFEGMASEHIFKCLDCPCNCDRLGYGSVFHTAKNAHPGASVDQSLQLADGHSLFLFWHAEIASCTKTCQSYIGKGLASLVWFGRSICVTVNGALHQLSFQHDPQSWHQHLMLCTPITLSTVDGRGNVHLEGCHS